MTKKKRKGVQLEGLDSYLPTASKPLQQMRAIARLSGRLHISLLGSGQSHPTAVGHEASFDRFARLRAASWPTARWV